MESSADLYVTLDIVLGVLTIRARKKTPYVRPGKQVFLLTCPLGKAPDMPDFNPMPEGKLDFRFFFSSPDCLKGARPFNIRQFQNLHTSHGRPITP